MNLALKTKSMALTTRLDCLPSAHRLESPRCLILWAVSPTKKAQSRDDADVRTMALEGTKQLTAHGHPQDGEAKEPRFWYKSSHLGGGALLDKAPLFSFPQAKGLYSATSHMQNAQCESGALYVKGLTGDYRKAGIMVTLFAEPRWKIRTGWRIYFVTIRLMRGWGRGSSKVH